MQHVLKHHSKMFNESDTDYREVAVTVQDPSEG